MSTLVRLTSTWGSQQEPCWIDPESVTGIVAAGLPACTRIDRGSQPCVLVLGTPDDVYALLFPSSQSPEDGNLGVPEVGMEINS